MLGSSFNHLVQDAQPILYPEDHADEIDALNQRTYQLLNNGVYRAGFAQSQEAYEEAYGVITSYSIHYTKLYDLVSLYQDLHAPAGAGQWFCIFEPQ